MISNTVRIASITAVALGSLFTVPAQAAAFCFNYYGGSCNGTSMSGHSCTFTTEAPTGFGGYGPYTVTAKHSDGSIAYQFSCPFGTQCQTGPGMEVPAGKLTTFAIDDATGYFASLCGGNF